VERGRVSALKELGRALTPPLLWSAASRMRAKLRGVPPPSPYHGNQELDRKLEKYVDFDGGFFLEIGGWDGVTFSNSLYFERVRGWRGVLIEPSPSEFLKCRANRPDARVFCYACVPFDYTERFVPMIYCASMTVSNVDGIAFDPRAHVEDGRKFLGKDEELYEFGAVAKPLSTVLDEHGVAEKIDLLILDVEGYELAVLRGLDFTRHAPRYICVEAWDLEQITSWLDANGYDFVEQLTKHDFLFVRRAGA
jgi:FkbM family methyltransferase